MISPIYIEKKLESKFKFKAIYFNKYFASKCIPNENDSSLPSSLYFYTHSRLCSLNLNEDDILKVIMILDINKAHGHDQISVRMIKIFDEALVKPLSLIYKDCIKKGIFPNM